MTSPSSTRWSPRPNGSSPTPALRSARSGYADAGYRNEHIDRLRERGITPLVAADADRSKGPRKTRLGGPYDFMRRVLQTDKGKELYSRRQAMVEPVFADIKQNRRAGRFKRRGRAAVRSEWRLIAATHNLLSTGTP